MNLSLGGTIRIHKEAGKERLNCVLAHNSEEVPDFLLKDKACEINDDGTLTLHAVEGPAKRQFPVYVSWEEVSEEKKDKVPGCYGSWPKDNGATTLVYKDGKLFDKAPVCVAAMLIPGKIPEYFAKMPNIQLVDGFCEVHTNWGEVRKAPLPTKVGTYTACLIEYNDGSVNLLTLTEPSAAEYILQDAEGNDIGYLIDNLV
jgi:hypothetical protein